ncbi:MAG TPA: hypothetical protein VJI68_00380 [Candidatus Nanoarchaeia archaeon]|nr:hypothetical protein [Candidatus Nanoarchaeia archaeon]
MGRSAYGASYESVETILNGFNPPGKFYNKLMLAGKNYADARLMFEIARDKEYGWFEQVQEELDQRYTNFLTQINLINDRLKSKGSTYQIPTNPLNVHRLLEGIKGRIIHSRRALPSSKSLENDL